MSDVLDRTVEFLARTSGRDKLARTVQYGCRYLLGHLLEVKKNRVAVAGSPSADALAMRIETLTKVMSSMSMCRQILRFGSNISLFRLLAQNPASWTKSKKAILQTVARVGLVVFFTLDHILWAQKVGILQLSAAQHEQVYLLSMWGWTISNLASIPIAWMRFQSAARDEKAPALRSLVSCLADTPLCLYFLHYPVISYKTSGLLGTVSSLIGLYETWPSSAKAKQP